MELFLDQAPEILTSLREAVEANDPGGNQRSAHYLRGSSGNIGAMRVEALGGSGKVDETTDVLAMLQKRSMRWVPHWLQPVPRGGPRRPDLSLDGCEGRRFRWAE